MQTDEITKIEGKVTAARARLLAVAEGLSDGEWEWQPGDGRWSVRLTLAHVGSAQWNHLEVAGRLAAGEATDIPGFDLDAWNAGAVVQRADWSVSQVLADLDAAHQETLAFLSELDPEKLSASGSHPALGEVTVGQVLRIIPIHDNMHRRDVLGLLAEMKST
jgi:uncharacterized damage-inducible protein DinB